MTIGFPSLCAVVAAFVAVAAHGGAVPPYGVCIHRMHFPEDRAKAFPNIVSNGIGYVRVDCDWRWIEPEKGKWSFESFDALFDDADRHGIRILPILHNGASWTKPYSEHYDDWCNFVRVFAGRYGGRCEAIEIWNEANLGHVGVGGPEQYARFLKGARDEVKKVDPRILVTTSGFAGPAVDWFETIYRTVGKDAFDVVNFHHYSFPHEVEYSSFENDVRRLGEVMLRYGDRGKPMWLTECGYPTHYPSLVMHNVFKSQLPLFDAEKRDWRVRMVVMGDETDNQLKCYARLMKAELPDGSDFRFVTAGRLAARLKDGDMDVLVLPFNERMPDSAVEEMLEFVRRGGVVAQFGSACMSYAVPCGDDGFCRFKGGPPNGAPARRRFGFDVVANYNDSSAPRRAKVRGVDPSYAVAATNVTVGMWSLGTAWCSRWMVPVESKDLPGLSFTPLLGHSGADGRSWTAAARLRMPGKKAGGLIIGCMDENEQNLMTATLDRQARTVARQYLIAQHLGCDKVFWYVYKTWEGDTEARRLHREPWFGLVRPATEEPKPAMTALKTLAKMRPAGSQTRNGPWRDEKDGSYFPQWTTPDGVHSGALWARVRRVGEPERGPDVFEFSSDGVEFFDYMGNPSSDVKPLGGRRFSVALSDGVVFFRGGAIVSPVAAALCEGRGRPHPRIFAFPGEVDERLRRSILRQADAEVSKPPPAREFDESGRRLLSNAAKINRRIVAFASAYRLSGDRRYAEAAEREMLAAAGWKDWNPAHWLDTAEMVGGLAIGCDWLWDVLPEGSLSKIRAACIEKGLATLDGRNGANLHWRTSDNNWNTGCWSAVVLGILAFHESMPETAAELLEEAIVAMPIPIEFLAPKGSYPEGLGYWGSVSGYIQTIDALESALGTDFGLSTVRGLRETADFPYWVTGSSGLVFNFSDAYTDPLKPRPFLPQTLWFAHRFGFHDAAEPDRAEISRRLDEADAKGIAAELGCCPVMLAAWGLRAPDRVSRRDRPLDWHSGGSQPIVVMRSGLGKDDAYVGIKGGKSAASHGHDDMGSFVFDAEGVRWALDLGANPYASAEKWRGTIDLWDNWAKEPKRWRVLRCSNRGHNLVTVDGMANDNFAFAAFREMDFGVGCAKAELDLTATSRRVASRHVRRFELDRAERRLSVRDEMDGVKPGAAVTWRMFTDAVVQIAAEGVVLEKGGKRRALSMRSNVPGAWTVRPANDLRREWDCPNDGIFAVDYSLAAPTDGKVSLDCSLCAAALAVATGAREDRRLQADEEGEEVCEMALTVSHRPYHKGLVP